MNIFLRLALNISVKLKETEVSDMFFYFTSRIASDVLSFSYHSAKLVPVERYRTESNAFAFIAFLFCDILKRNFSEFPSGLEKAKNLPWRCICRDRLDSFCREMKRTK